MMSWWPKGFDNDLNHANYVATIVFLKHKLIKLVRGEKEFQKISLVPAIHENNIYQPI